MDWNVWKTEHDACDTTLREKKLFEPGSEINLNEHDALAMSDEQMDGYLDWYEKTWLESEERERKSYSLPQELLDMFPAGQRNGSGRSIPQSKQLEEDTEHEALLQKHFNTQRALKTRGIVSEGKESKQTKRVRRIGSIYKRYRRVEDLPNHAKEFHEATAKVAGLSLPTLILAVFRMERKLLNWREEQLKKEAEESETDESADLMEGAATEDLKIEDTVSGHNGDVETDRSMPQSDNG